MYEFLRIRKAKLKLQFVDSPAVRYKSSPDEELGCGLFTSIRFIKEKIAQLGRVARAAIWNLKIKS